MKKEEAVQGFRALMQEINHLTCMEEEMMWDTRVNLPPRGAEYRSELMGYLSGQKYKLKTSPRMWEYLQELSQYTFDDVILNRMQEVARRDYDRLTKIPADLEARYAKHGIMTELIWQDARQNNDYESVKGVLKNSFEFKREYARCFGCDSVMDYLLDNWEQGCTTAQVDGIFSDIKGYVLPLLDKIRASGKPYSRQKLQGFYPREQQLALIHDVTALVGYNHEAGRIGESAHPFTLRICPRDDMRFTVTIHETDFTNALISSLHEGGHALYGQNLAPELKGTTLAWGTSWGFDEGQARFFENFVGRSLPFWKYIFPMAQERFPLLKNTTAEEFYQNLNAVNCGPLRLYADELTYNLHIILRYELEKLYYDGKADVDELPELWNDKYEEYLGYRPKNDAEGILQDVHWFSGWIGYYQCYVLANCYDGHFLHSSMKDIPDFWEKVSRGEFDEINDWHNRKVRCTGNLYSPVETLYRFSGETLTAKRYIQYLKDKFEPLYGI